MIRPEEWRPDDWKNPMRYFPEDERDLSKLTDWATPMAHQLERSCHIAYERGASAILRALSQCDVSKWLSNRDGGIFLEFPEQKKEI